MTQNHDHTHSPNRFAVIPIVSRVDGDPALTGDGVTIAFLDSGFYPHPDLIEPTNRILKYVDIDRPGGLDPNRPPEGSDWHGTQTAVVAAGNGHLSGGIYRGIASGASLVLVKVGERGRITEASIARGLEWVIENRERHRIRVVSISLGVPAPRGGESSCLSITTIRRRMSLWQGISTAGARPGYFLPGLPAASGTSRSIPRHPVVMLTSSSLTAAGSRIQKMV